MEKMLLFRLDDITPGLNRNNLKRFEEVFDTYGIKPMLGIVPCNEDTHLIVEEADEDFWNDMVRLKNKGWTIAQHGYSHVYSNECSGILKANPFSEFAGVPYEEQVSMISKGKEILEKHGLKPEFFMAPGHTFDENTLKALVACGIFRITDGYTDRPYIRDGVTFYPCTLSDVKVPRGLDTVCIHLNNWSDPDFEKLEAFIKENNKICADFEIVKDIKAVDYDEQVESAEERYRKRKTRRQKAAESDRMQRYLQRSYSDNKIIKIIKRGLFLPMLLRK